MFLLDKKKNAPPYRIAICHHGNRPKPQKWSIVVVVSVLSRVIVVRAVGP